jgi:hypothetical protein
MSAIEEESEEEKNSSVGDVKPSRPAGRSERLKDKLSA